MNAPVPITHHVRVAAVDRLATLAEVLEKALVELGTIERSADEMLHDEEGRHLLAEAAIALERARVHFDVIRGWHEKPSELAKADDKEDRLRRGIR